MALGPTQPPIQWVPGLSRGKEAGAWHGVDHPPHVTPRLNEEYSYIFTPQWAFVACYRVKFTFTTLMTGCVIVPHLPWQHAVLCGVSQKSRESIQS